MPTAKKVEAGVGKWGRDFERNQRKALEAVTKTLVEPAARRNQASQRIPQSNMIERRSGVEPKVVLLYSRFPWAAGAERGSKGFRQFKQYRGKPEDGYIVGAAVKSNEKAAAALAIKMLESELKEEL